RAEGIYPGTLPLDRVEVLVTNGNPSRVNIKQLGGRVMEMIKLSTTSTIIPADTKSKDKGKGIMVEEPKPLKKKQQVEMDEEYARKLQKNIWKKKRAEHYRALMRLQHKKKSREEKRFSTSKAKNFSDDFLLNTLGSMFEKPDEQAQVWKNQKSIHSQAKVKSWKLLESCGVHIIKFSTTQLVLLVERRYLLSRFTLDQMLNAVRLRVEEESKMSLELLSFGVDAAMDLKEKQYVFNAVGEEVSAARQKMMLLDSATERSLMLLSQVKTPFEVAFLELVKLIIVSSHRYPIQVLVFMPLDNLEFSDSDDSTLRINITSILPVDSKMVELLTFTPPIGDSSEGMLVVAYKFLNPHCPRHQVFNPLDVPVICCLCLGDRSSILAA
nr:hypothetical protein [Tanacetum cinerariifolium]